MRLPRRIARNLVIELAVIVGIIALFAVVALTQRPFKPSLLDSVVKQWISGE